MGAIRLNEALKQMETGEIFSLKFVKYDKQRKTGGSIAHFKEAKILRAEKSDHQAPQVQNKKSTKKAPNHFENSTRNIRICINGMNTSSIKRFHIFLLLEFNGQKVYL